MLGQGDDRDSLGRRPDVRELAVAADDVRVEYREVGLEGGPQVSPGPGLQADLAGRVAHEVATDRSGARGLRGVVVPRRVERGEVLPMPGDVQLSGEGDPLVLRVGRQLPVVDRVIANLRRLADLEAEVVLGLEARRRGDSDQGQGDPGVDDIAPITAPVAPERADD